MDRMPSITRQIPKLTDVSREITQPPLVATRVDCLPPLLWQASAV